MIRFTNDYSEGCHPSILEALAATNTEGNPCCSTDPHTEPARQMIRKAVGRPDADVHLLVGGTQTNAAAIAALGVIGYLLIKILTGMVFRTADPLWNWIAWGVIALFLAAALIYFLLHPSGKQVKPHV